MTVHQVTNVKINLQWQWSIFPYLALYNRNTSVIKNKIFALIDRDFTEIEWIRIFV